MGGDYNLNQKKIAKEIDIEDIERPTKKKGGAKKKFLIYCKWVGIYNRRQGWGIYSRYETEKQRLEAFKNLSKKEKNYTFMEFSLTNPDEEEKKPE